MGSQPNVGHGAGKTMRIDLRVEPKRVERITAAAAIAHESVSAFVLEAADRKADAVLDQASVTALTDEHFTRLSEALDAPYVPNAALQRAANARR